MGFHEMRRSDEGLCFRYPGGILLVKKPNFKFKDTDRIGPTENMLSQRHIHILDVETNFCGL